MIESRATFQLNPTDNQAYQPFCPRCNTSRGIRTVPTPDTKKWRKRAKIVARNAAPTSPLIRPLEVHVDTYAPRLWGFDVHGRGKLIFDVMSGIVYGDDRDIRRVVMTKHKDTDRPRVEVRVVSIQGGVELFPPQIDLEF